MTRGRLPCRRPAPARFKLRECESDPALGYELTRRLARVVARRLQATRVRLITASSLPADAR
jgi:hypothetical protein